MGIKNHLAKMGVKISLLCKDASFSRGIIDLIDNGHAVKEVTAVLIINRIEILTGKRYTPEQLEIKIKGGSQHVSATNEEGH